MLTFFRRIRKGLLEGGSTSKYLLYAIGEIALVVIGILIALQINNWNENRKALIEEDALYVRIINDLNVDQKKSTIILKNLETFQKTQFQVYEESIGKATYDSTTKYMQLRYTSRLNPIIRENHIHAIGSIRNYEVREQLNQYFKLESETIEALENSNNLRRGAIREFLTKNGILNTNQLYSVYDSGYEPIYNMDFIIYEKLRAQYGSVELDQILAELRMVTAWAVTNIKNLIDANADLKRVLEAK